MMTQSDPEWLKLAIANDLRELAGVAAEIDEFCTARRVSPHIAYAVNVSVEEVLTNTISYGYEDDEPHIIELSASLDAGEVVVEIVNDGMETRASSVPELDEQPLDGPGFFLLYQMMDSVEFRREDGFNIVTLRKQGADDTSTTGSRRE